MKTNISEYWKCLIVASLIIGLTPYNGISQIIFTGDAAKIRSTIKGANEGKIIKDNVDSEGRREIIGTIRIQGMQVGSFITCSYLVGRSDNIIEGSVLFPKDSEQALASLKLIINSFEEYGEKIDSNECKMDVKGNKYAYAHLFDNYDNCGCYAFAWKIKSKL